MTLKRRIFWSILVLGAWGLWASLTNMKAHFLVPVSGAELVALEEQTGVKVYSYRFQVLDLHGGGGGVGKESTLAQALAKLDEELIENTKRQLDPKDLEQMREVFGNEPVDTYEKEARAGLQAVLDHQVTFDEASVRGNPVSMMRLVRHPKVNTLTTTLPERIIRDGIYPIIGFVSQQFSTPYSPD